MLKVSKILDTFLQYMVVGLYGVYESIVRFSSIASAVVARKQAVK